MDVSCLLNLEKARKKRRDPTQSSASPILPLVPLNINFLKLNCSNSKRSEFAHLVSLKKEWF